MFSRRHERFKIFSQIERLLPVKIEFNKETLSVLSTFRVNVNERGKNLVKEESVKNEGPLVSGKRGGES